MEFINKSMIKVYRIDGLNRKEDEIDFKSTSWKKSDGLWENPQGWVPLYPEDAERVRDYTITKLRKERDEDPFGAKTPQGPPLIRKKVIKDDEQDSIKEEETSALTDGHLEPTRETRPENNLEGDLEKDLEVDIESQKESKTKIANPKKASQLLKRGHTDDNDNTIKETPLAKIKNDSWKDVLIEQEKENTKQKKENILSVQAKAKESYLKEMASKHEREVAKIRWAKRIAIGSIGAICLIAAIYYFSDKILDRGSASNSTTIFGAETSNSSEAEDSKGSSIWGYFYKENQNEPSIPNNTKRYILKYTIEEAIWLGKVKAALYDNQTGQVTWNSISTYTDFDSNLMRTISQVQKMYQEMRNSKLNVSKEDFKVELEKLRGLTQNKTIKEEEALSLLALLGGEKGISLGTYPHKKLAQRANKENWISPLGKLYSDVSAKSHHNRFIVSPNDPRSVGEPVKWIEN